MTPKSVGAIGPPDERPLFDLAVAEQTDANPPFRDLHGIKVNDRFGSTVHGLLAANKSKDTGDARSCFFRVRRMFNTVEDSHFVKVERAKPRQTGNIDAVLMGIGPSLMMSVDPALRTEIVFCRFGVKLIHAQRVFPRDNIQSVKVGGYRYSAPHPTI